MRRIAGRRVVNDVRAACVQELFRRLFGLGGASSQQGQQQQRQQQQQQQQQRRRQQQQQQQGQWEAQRRPATGDPRDPDGYYKALGVRPDATKDEIQVLSNGLGFCMQGNTSHRTAKVAGAWPRPANESVLSCWCLTLGNNCIRAQAAFRGQAQRLHPDHVSDPAKKPEATKRFQALLEAYQVLRDPSKRQAYDRGY